MTERMYMPYRKTLAVWVPLVEWSEAAAWTSRERCKKQGMTKKQCMDVINANRQYLPQGTRYRLVPIADYQKATDPNL